MNRLAAEGASREVVDRLAKRAAEIEAHAAKYPIWNLTEAVQHAADIRSVLRALEPRTLEPTHEYP